MSWNWQKKDWPHFQYNESKLTHLENEFLKNAGMLIGALIPINELEKKELTVQLVSNEAFKTSEIEGEILNMQSLYSSIARHFGLKTLITHSKPDEQGIADMMSNLMRDFAVPLSHNMLKNWHSMLMAKRTNLVKGFYRTHNEPMQVVSGYIGKFTVHFEAPPSKIVTKEMGKFVCWFNDTAPNGKNPLPALTRAAIAHLYFVCIHPFEDGNGRIARAIVQKSLFQSIEQPILISLSQVIEDHRKDYYAFLKNNNEDLDISSWITYFAKTIIDAQHYTQQLILFVIEKARLFSYIKNEINARQEKVLTEMFSVGLKGFEGGMSAEKYMAITKTSASTATRDLTALVEMKALIRTGELKHTRYFLNIKL